MRASQEAFKNQVHESKRDRRPGSATSSRKPMSQKGFKEDDDSEDIDERLNQVLYPNDGAETVTGRPGMTKDVSAQAFDSIKG